MARPRQAVPAYRLHKASGQAIVTVRDSDGTRRDVYLGVHNSPESRVAYADAIGDHTTPAMGNFPATVAPQGPLTLAALVSRFERHADTYYRRADGSSTNEAKDFGLSLRPLCHLFGSLPVTEFGPKRLQLVRLLMTAGYEHPAHGEQSGLARGVINQRVGRIKRLFKWGVAEELVEVGVYQRIKAVDGLKVGRSDARETEPVASVDWGIVEKTLPRLNPVVRAMVLFQWHTGCRPGEVCVLRTADIDQTGATWFYRPKQHKTAWRGKSRSIAIGPKAQEVITPFLESGDPDAFVFSPARAVEMVRQDRRAQRKTKVQPSQQNRKTANPKRAPRAFYATCAYDLAITRAAKTVGVPHWTPNQIRHSHATAVRRQFGLEAAQVILGHSNANVTQIYAERNESLAADVASKIG